MGVCYVYFKQYIVNWAMLHVLFQSRVQQGVYRILYKMSELIKPDKSF